MTSFIHRTSINSTRDVHLLGLSSEDGKYVYCTFSTASKNVGYGQDFDPEVAKKAFYGKLSSFFRNKNMNMIKPLDDYTDVEVVENNKGGFNTTCCMNQDAFIQLMGKLLKKKQTMFRLLPFQPFSRIRGIQAFNSEYEAPNIDDIVELDRTTIADMKKLVGKVKLTLEVKTDEPNTADSDSSIAKSPISSCWSNPPQIGKSDSGKSWDEQTAELMLAQSMPEESDAPPSVATSSVVESATTSGEKALKALIDTAMNLPNITKEDVLRAVSLWGLEEQ